MATTLNLKHPIVVIVGHWNTAILNEPGWIARHILGISEGEIVELHSLVSGNQFGQGHITADKQIWIFEHFGMSCSGQRIELFSRDMDNLQPLYDAASNIDEKLPHTPKKAIGVNFNFEVTGDLAAITPLLETDEKFDELGTIKSQVRTDIIKIPNKILPQIEGIEQPDVSLYLTRKTDFNNVEINFNYDLQMPAKFSLINWIKNDPIQHWKGHVNKVISDCYNIDDYKKIYL